MTAATMDVADLVKQMSENLEAIHAAVAGLSTEEHEAKLDELEQKRDTLLGDLKTEYDTEKEELAAKRKAEEEAVAEARRKEDEEREARRKAEDEEVRTRNEGQDAERLGKYDEETKRVEDEADDGMDAVEAEVQKLLAEGEAKLKELEEKRKEINRLLEEKMTAPLPPVVPRKRARDKAAEAAAAAAAAVAAAAGVAAGVDAAADAPVDAPADAPAEAAAATPAEPAPDADAKPDDAAEVAPAEADAENKENSKSEVSSSPPFDLDEQGSNDAKAIDGTAAPASEEAEEGAAAEAGPGEVDETAEAVQEEDTAKDTKEEDAEEGSKEEEEETAEAPPIEVPAVEVATDTDKAVEEEPAVESEDVPPTDEADDVVASRGLAEEPETAPTPADDATPKDEAVEEIPNYYDTTSPTIPQNDTSPVPNDDFELSPATDEAANETDEPISKEVIEETAEEDAAPVEDEVAAAASVEPEIEAEAPAVVAEPAADPEEPNAGVEEPAAVAPAAVEAVAVADAEPSAETVDEDAQSKSSEADEPAPTVDADTVTAAEADTADATEAEAVVEPPAEVADAVEETDAIEATDVATEEVVQSEDAPESAIAADTEATAPIETDENAETTEPALKILEALEVVDDAEKGQSLDAELTGDDTLSVGPEAAEPVVEEPVIEDVSSEELAAEKTTIEDVAAAELVVEGPTVEEAAVNEVASDDAVIEETAAEQSNAEDVASKELVVEEPATSAPPTDEPAAEEPVTDDPKPAELTVEEAVIAEVVAPENVAAEEPELAQATATNEMALDYQEPAVDAEVPSIPPAVENSVNEDTAAEEADPADKVDEADAPLTDEVAAVASSDEAASALEEAVEEQVTAAEAVVEADEPVVDGSGVETEPAADTPGDDDENVANSRALDLELEETVAAIAPETVPTEEASAEDTPSDDAPTAGQPVAEVVEVPSLEDGPVADDTASSDEPTLKQPEAESDKDALPSSEVVTATEPDVLASDEIASAIDPSEDEPLVGRPKLSDIAGIESAPADDSPTNGLTRGLDVDAETAADDEVCLDGNAETKPDELPVPQDDASLEAPAETSSIVPEAFDMAADDNAAIPADAAVAEPEVLDKSDIPGDVEFTTAEDLEDPAAPTAIEGKAADGDDEVTAVDATEAQPENASAEEPTLPVSIAGDRSLDAATLDAAAPEDEDEPQAIATDPFSDAAASSDNDAPVTKAEAIDATALENTASSTVDGAAETTADTKVEDDAVSVQTAVEDATADAVSDKDQALDNPAQPEDVNEPKSHLDSPADTTQQPEVHIPQDVSILADDPSDAPAVDKDVDSEEETSAAAEEATIPDTSVLSEAVGASTLSDGDATEDAAVPLADRELSPVDVQDNTPDVSAKEETLDNHDTSEPESVPIDSTHVTAMVSEPVASPATLGVSDDVEPIAASTHDAEDDSDDGLDVPIKPDTVDSQLTLVNGADTPVTVKNMEEPPPSPQSDAGSDAHEDESFLGTRDGGASAEGAGLVFEKHRDTPDASPSPGEDEGQPPIAGSAQDASSNDSHAEPDLSIPVAKNSNDPTFDAVAPSIAADAHIPFDDAEVDSAGDDHLTDSEDESPFGLSIPGTQDRSVAASSFAASPEMQDDGEPGPEISFKNSGHAIVDDIAEASRPSTPSEYGEVGRSAPEGPSQMDMSVASGDQESIPSSPLIESPYDLDDFVEDVATKQPLSPLPEVEDEDSNPFFADETSTLVGGHRALDDSPSHTFRGDLDESKSPTQEDTQEDPFHLSYEPRHQSNLAQHDQPFGEPHSAANAVDNQKPFDFRFDAETPGHIADAPAERDQVALSGLGLNTFDRGVSHQEQNEFAQLVSQDNNPFRTFSRGAAEDTAATRGIRHNDTNTNADFGRPRTFDPWDRQKSPELVQRGFGQPSPGLEHLNAPDLSTRSWTPAESPPVSPYRAASPDFKPWGTSSKPTSPALSQKWAPIGSNTNEQSNQGGWGGLPSARQQPALSFSPAPAFVPSTANNNLGYRRSEYSYEDDSDDASDYGKETKQDNRSSNGSLQDQFNGYRIKEQTIRVVDNHDAESTQSAVSTPRVCQPGPKLAPQSSSRDPLPSPLRLRHSVETLPEPTSPRRNPFARPEPPRPQTPPSQAPEEEDFDPEMFMPRDVTNVPWHARNDSAPVSLRSQSTLSSSPSSPVHSALHADKNEPVIRDSWPARPRNDSNLTDATGPDYDPFRQDTKTYQEPVMPVSQRWPASTSIPAINNASPVKAANDSPGSMFQKMRSIFENQGQGSPTHGRAGTDTSSPTRSRPVSGVWVPVRQSRQFATGTQVWESAFGDGQSRGRTGQREPEEPDERSSLLRGDDSH